MIDKLILKMTDHQNLLILLEFKKISREFP